MLRFMDLYVPNWWSMKGSMEETSASYNITYLRLGITSYVRGARWR